MKIGVLLLRLDFFIAYNYNTYSQELKQMSLSVKFSRVNKVGLNKLTLNMMFALPSREDWVETYDFLLFWTEPKRAHLKYFLPAINVTMALVQKVQHSKKILKPAGSFVQQEQVTGVVAGAFIYHEYLDVKS